MANIKSAKKRIVQTLKRTEINKFRKSKIRSVIKSINNSLSKKKKDDLKKKFLDLEINLARAASKGVFKKKTASRIISRLSQKIKVLKT
tara:strand:- start:1443 stop:1709 length:267 start_codon:yes stop_codon:yes gene_type:complete